MSVNEMSASTNYERRKNINFVFQVHAWLCVALIFIGDVRISMGESVLYTPLAFFPALSLFFLRLISSDVYFLRGTLNLVIVLIAGVVSTILSEYVSIARSIAATFPILATILILLALNGITDLHRIIPSAILAGGALLSIWVIALTARAVFSGLPFYEAKLLIETPLGRSNYLGAFLLVFLCFALHRSNFLAGLAFSALAALSIYSRGTALIFLFLLLIFIAHKVMENRRIFLIYASIFFGCCIILFGFLSLFVFEFNLVDYFHTDTFESVTNRLALWQASLEMIYDSPVFGIGPNGFRSLVEAYGLEDVWGPHNSVLLIWLNYGFIGLCFYLSYCFCVIQSIRLSTYVENNNRVIFTLIISLLIFSLFEPLIGSATFEILFGVLYLYSASTSAVYKFVKKIHHPLPSFRNR